MTARYSIMVREQGSDHDIELCQCDNNPQEIVKGLQSKTLTIKHSIFQAGPRVSKIPKYSFIRVVDRQS